MFASKSKFFAYYSIFSLLALSFYPLADANAKSINVGVTTDTVTIPGQLLNSKLANVLGNRCLYVDASGNVLAKNADCGTMTGGDNLGDHSATQNIRLNTYWLSGNGSSTGIYINSLGEVGVNTQTITAGNKLTVNGNLSAAGAVSFTGVTFAGGGNRMITVDNSGVLGAATIPVDTNTDIYWTGTATNLVAATGRTSLGLGALATLGAVAGGTGTTITDDSITNADINSAAAIADSKIVSGGYFITSAGTSGQLWSSDGTGAGAWATIATVPAAGTNGNTLRSNGSTWVANNLLYNNGSLVGINTTAPASANLQINASSTLEALRLVSAAGYSPLNIRNSGNTADIFRVDQTGSLAAGSVPWARLTSYPTACSGGQFVTAVGGTLTCASPAAATDIYWNGTATNLVAATGRASLGLGGLATLSAVGAGEITDGAIMNADINASAAIADSKIVSGAYFITAAGTSGQLWTSDGAGAGAWANNTGHTGSGTSNYVTKWTGASSMGNSIIYDDGTYVGIGTAVPGANKLNVNGNFLSSGVVTFSGPIYAGGGNRMVTVDNAGVIGAAAVPTDTDVYWTGTATNLNAGTARTSLGLGALATLPAVASAEISDGSIMNIDINASAAIADSKIVSGGYFITSAGTSGQLWSSDGTGAGAWATIATVPGAGTNGNTLRSNGSTWVANNLLYNNGSLVGINTTAPASANLQINASSTLEALRLVSAAGYSPLNIRNSGNTADIFRVDQTGSLAAGIVPWTRLASFPTACTAGQFVTGVGGVLTCATPPVTTDTDIYWTGDATNLNAATGRASLGLGTLAQMSFIGGSEVTDGGLSNADLSASAAISDSKIQSGAYFITSAGTSGQVWTSDGVGAGAWGAAGASHTGSGTSNYVTKWTGASSMGNSLLQDDGLGISVNLDTSSKFHIKNSLDGNSLETLRLENGGIGAASTYMSFYVAGTQMAKIVASTGNTLALNTNAADRLTIAGTGKIGINVTPAASEQLAIGRGSSDGHILSLSGAASYYSMFFGLDATGAYMYNNSSVRKLSLGVNSSRSNLVIDTTGNIGINTATPGAYKLNVAGTTFLNDDVTIASSGRAVLNLNPSGWGTATININSNTGGYSVINADGVSDTLKFQTGAVDRMTIGATGKVGIGTTTPTADLQVEGNIVAYDNLGPAVSGTSQFGDAVYGNGGNSGVHGVAYYSTGYGVFGEGDWGVYGIGTSYGGYFDGNGYFSGNLGVGMAPTAAFDLNGSLQTIGSITFKSLSGGGARILTVDNSGTVGAMTPPSQSPSAINGQTLRHNGTDWVSNSLLFNTGARIGIGTTNPLVSLDVVGTVDANAYSYQGTAGQSTSYSSDAVLTGALIWGGIITSSSAVTGTTTTVSVRNAANTASCNLVFTKGVLVSETCP